MATTNDVVHKNTIINQILKMQFLICKFVLSTKRSCCEGLCYLTPLSIDADERFKSFKVSNVEMRRDVGFGFSCCIYQEARLG